VAENIKLRAAREENDFGDPIGPVPEWRTVRARNVVPRSSDDYEQRGTIIISGFMVVVSSSVEVDAHEEVEIRGKVYQIDGEIGDYGRKKVFYTTRAN
jgi:hypothetical protein